MSLIENIKKKYSSVKADYAEGQKYKAERMKEIKEAERKSYYDALKQKRMQDARTRAKSGSGGFFSSIKAPQQNAMAGVLFGNKTESPNSLLSSPKKNRRSFDIRP